MKHTSRTNKIYSLLPAAFFLTAVVVTAGFTGCTQQDLGIFYSLEVESELDQDRGLEDSLKVWNMTKTGSGNYYIAAGAVYSRDSADTGTWDSVSPPAAGMLSSQVAFFSGEVYSIFRTSDGRTSKLYSRTDTDGASWTEVNVSGSADESVTSAFVVDTTLFVCIQEDIGAAYKPYTLWYSVDGTTFTQTTLNDTSITGNYSMRYIFDGVFDGADFHLISGNTLFSGSAASLTATALTDSGTAEINHADFGGIYFADSTEYTELPADMLFLSAKNGVIYTKESPNTYWHSAASVSTEAQPITFYDMELLRVDAGAAGIVPILLIGSNNGYYEVTFDGTEDLTALEPKRPDTDSLSTSINYLNTTLSTGTILKFFFDDKETAAVSDDYLFACTSSYGLWVNNLGADGRIWSRE